MAGTQGQAGPMRPALGRSSGRRKAQVNEQRVTFFALVALGAAVIFAALIVAHVN
jgi:hypothetical protein